MPLRHRFLARARTLAGSATMDMALLDLGIYGNLLSTAEVAAEFALLSQHLRRATPESLLTAYRVRAGAAGLLPDLRHAHRAASGGRSPCSGVPRSRSASVVTAGPVHRVDRASCRCPRSPCSTRPARATWTGWWPNCDIDIVWQNTGGYDFDWRWEGYIASYGFSLTGTDSSFTIDLKGASTAWTTTWRSRRYPQRPIPYEILIAKAFDQDEHPARLGKFRILFPSDWTMKVPEFNDPAYLSALKPWGVATGQLLDRVHLAVHRHLGADC